MSKFKHVLGEDLILDHLKSFLSYKSVTGIFIWKRSPSNIKSKVGQLAGTKDSNGYIKISLKGISYPAHRLAWYFYHGYMPEHEIDHKNGIRNDNRIINLRKATHAQNMQNRRKASKNKAIPYLGVFEYGRNRYISKIGINYKTMIIGVFPNIKFAKQAYLEAKRELHEFCTI